MVAIVLTFDKYHALVDHMIYTYQVVWPTNPFCFRVPYQIYPKDLMKKYGDIMLLRKTKKDIKNTVLELINDLDDDEWIYWCIDDRYLIDIDEIKVNKIISWIKSIDDTKICGILLNRFHNLLREENLVLGSYIYSFNSEKFIRRRNYKRIWNPQFLRVKVIRYLFNSFPDVPFAAKEMDFLKDKLEPPQDQELYVSELNYFVVGESTTRGKLTKNCLISMIRANIEIPEYFEVSDKSIIQGELVSSINKKINQVNNFVRAITEKYCKFGL